MANNLSPEILAALQAEGLVPAPVDWVHGRQCRARTGEEVDALDDPLKAARLYRRAMEQEAEWERKHRYVRGLPPLEEEAGVSHAVTSVPRASAPPPSDFSAEHRAQPRTDNIRVRHRARSSVTCDPDTATRPDLKIVAPPQVLKPENAGEDDPSVVSATDAAVGDVGNPAGSIAIGFRVRRRTRPSTNASPTAATQPAGVAPDAGRELEIASGAANEHLESPATSTKDHAGPAATQDVNTNDNRSDRPAGDYSVGKGKPPLHTRFKPGQCGNLNGRPKGAKNTKTVAQKVLARKLPATINGKKTNLTGREGIIEKQFVKALNGDLKSAEFMFKHAGDAPPERGKGEGTNPPSSAIPEPLNDAQSEILDHFLRDRLEAAGVDPAKIESILKGFTEDAEPSSGGTDALKRNAGGSR